VRGDVIWFDFDAKSGQHLQRAVVDREVLAVITVLRRRRAPASEELLAYKDEAGRWVDLTAEDINEYLHEHLGPDCSAKDFRTWVGTVLAAVILADRAPATSVAAQRRQVREAVTEVAQHLGNTPAVARSAYIDPRVVDRFEEDDTIVRALRGADLEGIERAVARLVRRAA
jgi:DNA topoisomerase IB